MNPRGDRPLLLVDGHNVVHSAQRYRRVEKDAGMRAAVDLLVSDLIELAAAGEAEIIAVFDGRGGGSSEPISPGLTVVYSPANRSADSVIERLVFKLSPERDITVCTADYGQQKVVWREGVRRLFPAGLLDRMTESAEETRSAGEGGRPTRVEDVLPDDVRAALDKMRK